MDLFIFVLTDWIATCRSWWPIVLLSQRSGVRLFHKRSGRAVSVYGLNTSQDTRSFLDTRRFQSLAAFWFESSVKTLDCKRFPSSALIFLFAVVAFVDMQNESCRLFRSALWSAHARERYPKQFATKPVRQMVWHTVCQSLMTGWLESHETHQEIFLPIFEYFIWPFYF